MKNAFTQREKKTVEMMIRLYCRHHYDNHFLCSDCIDLHQYAQERIDRCVFGSHKPACSECPVHCYKLDYREKIRKVMKFAGPKMIFSHPILAMTHMVSKRRSMKIILNQQPIKTNR